MEVHSTHISQNFLGYSRKTCTWEYPGDVCHLIDFMSEADRANANSNVGCDQCRDIVDQKDVPHVIRICPGCGRTMYVHESGDHGIGMQVRKGDALNIPLDWMRPSFNPLEGNMRPTHLGLQWMAEMTLLHPLPDQSRQEMMLDEFALVRNQCLDALRRSPLLIGLNVENEADWPKIWDAVKDTPEFWRVRELGAIEQRCKHLNRANRHRWPGLRCLLNGFEVCAYTSSR